jgi:hypothetical protein
MTVDSLPCAMACHLNVALHRVFGPLAAYASWRTAADGFGLRSPAHRDARHLMFSHAFTWSLT